ncbi:unnamed protein product [Closterium sp. NIES-54]
MARGSSVSLRFPSHLAIYVLLAISLCAFCAVQRSDGAAAFPAEPRRLGDPKLPLALAAVEALLRQAQFDVAVGEYDRAARRLFSPVAEVSIPGRPLQRLETLEEKAAFLESIAPIPPPSPPPSANATLSRGLSPVVAASLIERAELYVPKYDRYLGYSLLTFGRLLQEDAESAEPRTGKFVLLWDLVADNGRVAGDADVESSRQQVSNSVYAWGLSWAYWNDDAHRHGPPPSPPPHPQPHPPHPPHPHPPAPAPAPAALSAVDSTVRDARAALGSDDGRQPTHQLSLAKPLPSLSEPERSLTEPLADPHPADLKLQIQEAWTNFSLNLATADVAAAVSIFADNVTLLPPGHPKLNLPGPLDKQEYLQRLVDCHVALDVTVDSLLLVKLKSSLTPVVPPPPPAPEALPFQDASSVMLRGYSATDLLADNEELNSGASNGDALSVITRSSFILTNSSTGMLLQMHQEQRRLRLISWVVQSDLWVSVRELASRVTNHRCVNMPTPAPAQVRHPAFRSSAFSPLPRIFWVSFLSDARNAFPLAVRSLFRTLLREAHRFRNYNVRHYASRRIREGFAENKDIADPEKAEAAYEEGVRAAAMVRRQVVVYNMYAAPQRSIMELDNP